MSYRDIRNFIEMNRALGYTNLISMESFRSPNFPLTAEILVWLVKRFDPEVDIALTIETEDDRVNLIRNVAQFMALKANIRLNTKRLYQADGYAVKEMLKITSLLYEALNVKTDEKDDSFEKDTFNINDFDITDKVNELRLSRQLASEITSTGATLFELLGKEVDLREQRHRSLSRQFEITELENGLAKAIEHIKDEIQNTNQMISNVSSTESNLDSKIERRKVEIDRYEKRLQTLKKVRPAFLDEFTALEKELEDLFNQYSTKQRCLSYLEKLYAETERAQYEKQLNIASPRVETIPFENKSDPSDDVSENEGLGEQKSSGKMERPRAGTGGRRIEKTPKAFGTMQPGLQSGSGSSLDLSSDSESDELILGKDEVDLMNSDDESLAFEINNLTRRAPSGRATTVKSQMQANNSDDDF